MLPSGARTTSTPPKSSSTSSASAAPYRTPETTVNAFAHLQSIIHTDIEREELGRGITAFWRRMVDEPGTFPPEFWQLFLQSSVTALRRKNWPVCVDLALRRVITAGAIRQWRPRLEEINR